MNPHLEEHEEGLRFIDFVREVDESRSGDLRMAIRVWSKHGDGDIKLEEHSFFLGTLAYDLRELVRLATVGKVMEDMARGDQE